MTTRQRIGILLIFLLILVGCGAPGATVVPSEKIDLTGYWTGTLTQELQSGPCPSMPAQTGDVLIEQVGDDFTMELGAGFDCDPVEACEFDGHIEGDKYTAMNSGIADDEGGFYTTIIEMYPDKTDSAVNGFGSSTYTHPEMECEWQTSLMLVPR